MRRRGKVRLPAGAGAIYDRVVVDDARARLLTRLRAVSGDPMLDWAEPPAPLPGGFETTTYAIRFRAAGAAWSRPLVLRLLPPNASPAWLAREAAVLRRLGELAFPVPALRDVCPDPAVAGGPYLLMERLDGTDLLTDAIRRRSGDVTSTLAALQARLHALDPGALAGALGTLDEPFADLEARLARARLDGLAPGLAWLRAHRPPARETVVCHGDFHPRNVLVRDGVVAGVIDWSLVVLAPPEFDVGSTRLVLAYAPVELPAPLAQVAGVLQRGVVAPRYERAYRRRRAVDARAIEYYEALRAFRCLVWAGEARRLAEGMALDAYKRGPWHEPRTARRLARRFRRLTGIEPTLP